MKSAARNARSVRTRSANRSTTGRTGSTTSRASEWRALRSPWRTPSPGSRPTARQASRASVLRLSSGVGTEFLSYVYERARSTGQRFGAALLSAHADGYPGAPRSSNVACRVVEAILDWANATALPPGLETRWGEFVGELASSGAFDSPTDEFLALVHDLDDLIEPSGGLGRYLGQITPLAKDLSLTRGDGVRIMTMAGAKGLTVDATIVGGVEEGVVPRPNFDRSEERRLLYVAMTRARSHLFLTWARRRSGPTARAGAPRVGSLRQPSSFLAGGSPASEDGVTYLAARGRRVSASPIS
jgi:hypothetical protein